MTDRPEAWGSAPDPLDRACREAGEELIRASYGHELAGKVELNRSEAGQPVSLRLELTPEQAILLAQVLKRCRKRKSWWRKWWGRSSKQ